MAMEYKDVGTLTAEGFFNLQINVQGIQHIQNVLGIALEKLENSPISRENLEWIGEASSEYAKELLITSRAYKTGTLYHSVGYRIPHDNRLEIFAAATDPVTRYPYGSSVEYGFHPWGKSQYVSPRPFLRPAIKYAQLTTKYSIAESVKRMLQGDMQNIVRMGFFPGQKPYAMPIGSKINRASPTHGMKGVKGTYMTRLAKNETHFVRSRNRDGRAIYRQTTRTTAGRHVKVPAGRQRQTGIKQHYSRFSSTPSWRGTSGFRQQGYRSVYNVNLKGEKNKNK